MQMLIFYIIAILISSYESSKEKQTRKQASEANMPDIANRHLPNYNNLPLRHR